MYSNAGLISLPYPIAVFGYALLEENRPRKEFWDYVRIYTIFVLFLKFAMNLSIFEATLQSESYKLWSAYLQIGIYDYPTLIEIVGYMIPEIMIISFIMLNEIYLNLVGLYYVNEQDVETITDGRERLIAEGDQEQVDLKKVFTANMAMVRHFYPKERQIKETRW